MNECSHVRRFFWDTDEQDGQNYSKHYAKHRGKIMTRLLMNWFINQNLKTMFF